MGAGTERQAAGAAGAARPARASTAATEAAAAAECDVETVQARPHRTNWARLVKRAFDIDMQRCPHCDGGELEIIAAILERPEIEKILSPDPQPRPKGRARRARRGKTVLLSGPGREHVNTDRPAKPRPGVAARHGGQMPQDQGQP